jgi:hypothetical protein
MAQPQPSLRPTPDRHFHAAGAFCPVCDQPIPNEKAEQVRARLEEKERELSDAVALRMREQFAQERAQIEGNARAVLEQAQRDAAEAIEKVKTDSASSVTAAREEGKKIATLAARQQIDSLTTANTALQITTKQQLANAESQKNAAVRQLETLKADHENIVNQRVQQAREALEKDKTDALNVKDAYHAEETRKLTDKLEEFKRQLEKKRADELGEGAEVKLFDALKAEFGSDKIDRVGRGEAGADIKHVVIHNGKECGIIVYDSKDRGAWRNDYVDKLAKDQRAAKAEHAILSTRKFPANTTQLHVEDGVIIANPARVVALVQVLRKHIVHVHAMRLSNTERAKKTAALYDFITSKRCTQLLDSIDTYAEDLLKLQEKEKRAHDSNWKQQGTLYRSIQKARVDFGLEIDHIIEGE